MIVLLKNPVEIAGIVISGQGNDVLDRERGGGKQESSLV